MSTRSSGNGTKDIDYGYCDPDFNNPRNNHLLAATAGYRRLIIAIATDAFYCLGSRDTEVRAETEAWIASDEYLVFSFRTICDVLGLDPEYLRANIKARYQERGVAFSLEQHLWTQERNKDLKVISHEEADYLEQFEEPKEDSDF